MYFWREAANSVSKASEDFPPPDGPQTAVNLRKGMLDVDPLQVMGRDALEDDGASPRRVRTRRGSLAPFRPPAYSPRSARAGQRRGAGRDLVRRAGRRRRGRPSSPLPGPRSTTRSAARMTSGWCSTATIVRPRSTSPWRAATRFSTSARCRPVVGSSRT
ncbi:MAG: hypothetical protein MZU91_11205 [Desulfosudis oleivorans]|nr:hypothetical protein [Desulfosudis oleivorans]